MQGGEDVFAKMRKLIQEPDLVALLTSWMLLLTPSWYNLKLMETDIWDLWIKAAEKMMQVDVWQLQESGILNRFHSIASPSLFLSIWPLWFSAIRFSAQCFASGPQPRTMAVESKVADPFTMQRKVAVAGSWGVCNICHVDLWQSQKCT